MWLLFDTVFILSSAILDLRRFGMNHATDVVIAGCSAGGLAVLLNIDRIRLLLPASARVRGLSDAGFFIDAVDRNGEEFLCVWRIIVSTCISIHWVDVFAY